MRFVQRRSIHTVIAMITVLSMLLSLLTPLISDAVARAQEATPEPAAEVTDVPAAATEVPQVPQVTETPAEITPAPAVTDVPVEATAETTAPVSTPTAEVTLEPTPTAVFSVFSDDFQDGNTDGWLLTEGWQIITEENNAFLRFGSSQNATIAALSWEHVRLLLRVRIGGSDTINIALRTGTESYVVSVRADGYSSLSRSGVLLAESVVTVLEATPEATAEAQPPAMWRTIAIEALGSTIVVLVDGFPQFTFTDPAPLGAGAVSISAGADNQGMVDLDDVTISQLPAPAVPVPTQIAPELTPETTPFAEVTPELTPVVEATAEPDAAVIETLLSTDFSGDLSAWTFGELSSVIDLGEGNFALSLAPNDTLRPTEPLYLADVEVDARFNISTDLADGTPNGFSLVFRGLEDSAYVLSVETDEVGLHRVDGETLTSLAAVAAQFSLNTWYNLTLTTRANLITVSVDGIVVLEFIDETDPLIMGLVAFTANNASTILLDDIALRDAAAAVLSSVATPLVSAIDELYRDKVDEILFTVVNTYAAGDEEAAVALADEHSILVSDDLLISVIVSPAEGFTAAEIAAMVEATGGVVEAQYDAGIYARVSMMSFAALVSTKQVAYIRQQAAVFSSSASFAPNAAPLNASGSPLTEGFDIVGANAWHEAGVTGTGVVVAVIDTGGTHMNNVVEVIRDIAPGATIRTYPSTSNAQIAANINTARTAGANVILITIDMGANVSPGDGTGAGDFEPAVADVYSNISTARAAGVVVIASAGNSANRYVSFVNNGAASVTVDVNPGDVVNVRWSGSGAPALGGLGASTAAGNGRRFTNPSDGTLTINGGEIGQTIQVQILGNNANSRITGGTTGSPTTGTIARPADSQNVIAVGSVCARYDVNYDIVDYTFNSSYGPNFALGGSDPGVIDFVGNFAPGSLIAQPERAIKPEVVAPSGVSTSASAISESGADCDGTRGFNGTSAAAAHVAGMTALLISSPNPNLDAFNNGATNRPTAVENYLMMNTNELPFGATADGFDPQFGAGLTVLGDPETAILYNSSGGFNVAAGQLADSACTTGDLIYVGKADPYTENLGDPDEPYAHPGFAIAEAEAGDCIVLFPGLYHDTLFINNALPVDLTIRGYAKVSSDTPTIFWVTNAYRGDLGNAVVYVQGNNPVIQGIYFKSFLPYDPETAGILSLPLVGVALFDSATTTANGGAELRESIIENFDDYNTGTTTIGVRGRLINVENGSQGVEIVENVFIGNDNNLLPLVDIASSGTTTPIIVELNQFTNNDRFVNSSDKESDTLVNIGGSFDFPVGTVAHVYSNQFSGNYAQALIDVNVLDANEIHVASNVFVSNVTQAITHLNPGRRVRFVNNTVANNDFNSFPNYGGVVIRGVFSANPAFPGENIDGRLEVHNNLIYNNNFNPAGGFVSDVAGNPGCDNSDSIDGGAPLRYNYVFNDSFGVIQLGGDCDNVFNTLANSNQSATLTGLAINPARDFIGPNADPVLPITDPLYYQPFTDDTNFCVNDNSIFENAGDNSEILALPSVQLDAKGAGRIIPPIPNTCARVDIGGFEVSLLQTYDLNVTVVEDSGEGTNGTIHRIDLVGAPNAGVDDGFPDYSFEILTTPVYSGSAVSCGAGFSQGLRIVGEDILYCAPRDFYTAGVLAPISFDIRVTDQSRTSGEFTVTVTIAPRQDTPIQTTLGSGTPAAYEVVAAINGTATFRLRPFVRFDNGFVFSERNNTQGTASREVDYEFTYTNPQAQTTGAEDENTALFDQGDLTTAFGGVGDDGLISVQITPNETGFREFTYQVQDGYGSTVTNRVRIRVVELIPQEGLHDDTSLAFNYFGAAGSTTPGGWLPLYSEANINNTLHQTTTLNDVAEFTFVGTGFILYMQGNSRGNNYELLVDGVPYNGSCTEIRTSATQSGGGLISNLNRFNRVYTVSCNGMEDTQHTITITNKAAATLAIDAVGILRGDQVVTKGFHDVNDLAVFPLFGAGWTENTTDTVASNGVVMTTTNPNATAVEFSFRGSGVAIGTMLEGALNPTTRLYENGAVYRVCIDPEGAGAEVCQTFNNGVGATSRPVANVFRPFMGYDPAGTHRVSILIDAIPAGTRFSIDSIVVFGEEDAPIDTLPFGSTQDDARGLMIFGNGIDDSWATDTISRLVSSKSLTSQNRGIIGAGPYATFTIPGTANAFYWARYVNTRSDSQKVLVCVDRAKGVSNSCQEFDLRTAPNPIAVQETGSSWGVGTTHTVEIFSLTNNTFSMDFVQVLNTGSPFSAGTYEHDSLGPISRLGTFAQIDLVNRSFSGGDALQTYTTGDAVLFRFTGTGFQPRFLLDSKAGNVEICWAKGSLADVAAVDAAVAANNGACTIVNNYAARADYLGYRTFAGLENTTHTAYIQHVGTTYNASTRLGNIMVLDTVTVLNNDWSTLNVLDQTDTRYETSYTNRLAANNFLYLGEGWRSFTGSRNRLYSGFDYDQITRVTGAGVVFLTDNADIVRLYRDTRNGYAKLLVCTAPYTGTTVNYGGAACLVVLNNGGTGNQQIYNIPLSGSGNHIVSITTLENTTFNLDAIELVNSVAALTPGTYPETHPGLSYDYAIAPTTDATVWRNIPLAGRHVDGTALESTATDARLTFGCDNCTGFTLFTTLDRLSGAFNVTVTGGSVNIANYTFSAYDLSTIYGTTGGRLSLLNLPVGDYTFTIRENEATRSKFIVDGVIIYGDDVTQQLTPDLYDDNARTINGDPQLLFGPTSTDWTFGEGRSAPTDLFQTIHYSLNYGAQARFRVENGNAVTFYTNSRTSTTALRICAVPVSGAITDANYRCTTVDVYNTYVRNRIFSFTLSTELFPSVGDYFVSVVNLGYRRAIYLDAVGVHDLSDGSLEPGIYHTNHPQVTTNFAGFSNLALATATDGFVAVGQSVTFSFEGTGFSVVLVEGPTRSTGYTLNIDGGGATALTPSGNTRDGLVAITRIGLSNATHTVTLTNTSPNALHIDRIDILGATPASKQIAGDTVGVIENTDPRITYFPYSSFAVVTSTLASGGSQYTTTMPGALAYFEVTGFNSSIQYGRQTLSSYGNVDICYGGIGSGACNTPDQTTSNTAPTGLYQQVFTTNAIGGTNNYVAFENAGPTTGIIMPVDFFRLTNPNAVLTDGTYDDTFAIPANTNNLAFTTGAFTDTTLASAFGGSFKVANAAGSALVGVFEGSGFSVLFTLDRLGGNVEICWAAGDLYSGDVAAAVTAVGTANCETFDNNSAATRYKAMRTIAGLDFGTYTFFARHAGTSYDPVLRTGNTMQIDGLNVYGEDIQTVLTQITPTAGRVETNYANRLDEGQFFYIGDLWTHFTGSRYRTYSGQNYDQSRNEIGAGVVFRTNNANSMLIYRDIRAGYAPMLVCAAPESNLNDRLCTLVNNGLGTGVQQAVSVRFNTGGSTAPHVVSIVTEDYGLLNLDAIELFNAGGALTEGRYEDVDPRLTFTGDWTYLYGRSYSDGRTRESRVGDPTAAGAGDTLTFSFTGTGVVIAAEQSLFVGEMEVCYGTNATWGDADDNCYLYQNESRTVSYTTLRTITGLAQGTYFVRVRNAEDGQNNILYTPPRARTSSYAPGRMRIDYVQVLGDALSPVIDAPGFYNELDTDDAGTPLLQLQPAGRWASFTGSRLARGYSFLSYVTLVDVNARVTRSDAGPTATMRVEIPANTDATVILYTGLASTANSAQLLICANSVDTDTCVVSNKMTTDPQVIVDSSMLAALNNTTGSPVTVTLSFRTLTPGFFRIDGFQIIHGTRLTVGIYDSVLPETLLDWDSNGSDKDTTLDSRGRCTGGWCTIKNASLYNGSYVTATTLGSTLDFSFSGTGISVILLRDRVSAEMRVCYKSSSLGTAFPLRNEAPAAGINCQIVPPEARSTFLQYGYTIYGLPNGNYDVQIMVHNQLATTYGLKIDAIAVFGDPTGNTPLTSGQVYDDTAEEIVYTPEVFWTANTLTSSPPRGPWNKTETTATVAGAVVQLQVTGNGMILYQTADSRSSANARMCFVTENDTPGPNENENVVCTEFSQNSRRAAYFTPILFYGFGSDTHTIYLENRDHGRTFRIDGIRIID